MRFSRDKRGYENTYVFHASKLDNGSQPRLLYWFRSPPGVRVGRLSLDADVIRALEENNPGVSFDWNKLLKVRSKASSRQEQSRSRDRRTRRTASVAEIPVSESQVPQEISSSEETSIQAASQPSAITTDDEQAAEVHIEALVQGESVSEEAGEHPVVTLMGYETLARLRVEYSEVLNRIENSQLSSEDRNDIRVSTERLDPDRWSEIEEAVAGIECFDTEVEAIRAQLVLYPLKDKHEEG